ncbi:MAG: hypothetical protein JSW51_03515 [Gemmatimonadota bacterium]|nr:MAG: hypothetical protein JSW51_03515 [Gemmatimonadota bacterium]
MAGYVGAAWGVLGVSLLLAIASYRLARLAAIALDHALDWQHWAGSVIFTAFMLYSEGYRGFQLSFSPMVAARARYLRANPRLTHVVLAPAFCMGYFHATRARRIKSTLLTIMIVIFVVLVQRIEQPWRGIVDAGVVAGLAWGLVTLVVFCHQALSRREFRYSPETPEIGQS